jgi:hypothetical protein
MKEADTEQGGIKQSIDELQYNRLHQQIKQDELASTFEMMDSINFGAQSMIKSLYAYRHKEYIEKINIASDCLKDYNKSKFELPSYIMKRKKFKKK